VWIVATLSATILLLGRTAATSLFLRTESRAQVATIERVRAFYLAEAGLAYGRPNAPTR
jgi:hypothetical protein